MFKIGRVVVKIAGRDAGKKACIIDVINENYVLIDGETRRRKCNIKHLEPLNIVVKIKRNANHETVIKTLKEAGVDIKEKPKARKEKPKTKKEKK